MVSKVKLYSRLDALEAELKEKLIPLLETAVVGKNDLVFCVEEFNPFLKLRFHTCKETEALIGLGRQVLALQNKLGEPSDDSIAARLCWYCRKWGDISNDHRKSAQGLARQFLDEIE